MSLAVFIIKHPDMQDNIVGCFTGAQLHTKAKPAMALFIALETLGTDGSCAAASNHAIWGDGPFGIWVYGVFADTSYGYPGGMNLEQINDVVIVVE